MFLLDTNICIYLIKKRSPELIAKLLEHSVTEIALSSITLSELKYGVHKSQHQEKNAAALERFLFPFQVLPYDDLAANAYGKLRAELERKGALIGSLDMLIAAHAIAVKAVLVTNNTKEFSRVAGLKVENWTK